MSLYDYRKSLEISNQSPPFASLITAAMRKADTRNLAMLRVGFPEIYTELMARYNAPGGLLAGEVEA